MTSDYVYLPDYEGEWSVMLRSEFDQTGGEAEYGRAVPAEQVISLEDYRGHYLRADFIIAAWDLLPDIVNHGESEPLQDARATALVYRQHGGACDEECESCGSIDDDVDNVEGILSTHGYVIDWSNGVSVYKVEGVDE